MKKFNFQLMALLIMLVGWASPGWADDTKYVLGGTASALPGTMSADNQTYTESSDALGTITLQCLNTNGKKIDTADFTPEGGTKAKYFKYCCPIKVFSDKKD